MSELSPAAGSSPASGSGIPGSYRTTARRSIRCANVGGVLTSSPKRARTNARSSAVRTSGACRAGRRAVDEARVAFDAVAVPRDPQVADAFEHRTRVGARRRRREMRVGPPQRVARGGQDHLRFDGREAQRVFVVRAQRTCAPVVEGRSVEFVGSHGRGSVRLRRGRGAHHASDVPEAGTARIRATSGY